MNRVHCIEHVAFETPGRIADWVVERGHSFASTRVYDGEPFPSLDSFDALVVMGGPMGVHDDERFAWLADEKRLIDEALRADKRVLGVCLGAQLIANVLGARVYRNRFQEIGWFPVQIAEAGRAPWGLPREILAFHWHGDAFDLPRDAVHLAKSAACEHQMFAIGTNVLGIQFHLEVTRAGVEDMLRHGAADLGEGPYVQTPAAMLAGEATFAASHALLDAILDRWSA
jgi:GMP synthase (glutamine-hydrolysing)